MQTLPYLAWAAPPSFEPLKCGEQGAVETVLQLVDNLGPLAPVCAHVRDQGRHAARRTRNHVDDRIKGLGFGKVEGVQIANVPLQRVDQGRVARTVPCDYTEDRI